jgi:hypothetical protein
MKSRKRIYKKRRRTKRRYRGGGILKPGNNNPNKTQTFKKKTSFSFNPTSTVREFGDFEFTDRYIPTKTPNNNNSLNKNNLLVPAPYPTLISEKLKTKFSEKRLKNPLKYWRTNQWCMYYIKLLKRKKEPNFIISSEDQEIYDKIRESRSYRDDHPCANRIFNIISDDILSKSRES